MSLTPVPLSLYQLTADLLALENALDIDENGSLNPETMGALIESIQTKTDSVVGLSNYLDDQVATIDARIAELSAYKKSIAAKCARLDVYVASCLDKLGTSKIEGKLSTISRRAPADVVEVTDENALPIEFLRTKVEPEKNKIKAALKDEAEVPGAHLKKSTTISITYKNSKPLSRKQAAKELEAAE